MREAASFTLPVNSASRSEGRSSATSGGGLELCSQALTFSAGESNSPVLSDARRFAAVDGCSCQGEPWPRRPAGSTPSRRVAPTYALGGWTLKAMRVFIPSPSHHLVDSHRYRYRRRSASHSSWAVAIGRPSGAQQSTDIDELNLTSVPPSSTRTCPDHSPIQSRISRSRASSSIPGSIQIRTLRLPKSVLLVGISQTNPIDLLRFPQSCLDPNHRLILSSMASVNRCLMSRIPAIPFGCGSFQRKT